MADLSITITTPTLSAGESFRERHRLLPAGAWSSYVSRTNSIFTLTGLTAGTYQFEFSLLRADGTICPATYKTYTVVEEESYTCPSFTITQVLSPDRIKIEYTGGSGTPPCGYNIRYSASGSGVFANVHYATLPASPFYINVPVTGKALQVQVLADQCDGSTVCYDASVPYPPKAPCTPLSGLDWEITPIEGQFQNKKKFAITITASSQSTIPTTNVTVNAAQTNVISPSVRWNATLPITGISPTAFSMSVTLEFNISIGTVPAYYWVISFVDACGFNHVLSVQYP